MSFPKLDYSKKITIWLLRAENADSRVLFSLVICSNSFAIVSILFIFNKTESKLGIQLKSGLYVIKTL